MNGKTMTQKELARVKKALKSNSFSLRVGAYGAFVPMTGLPGLEGLEIRWVRLQTRLGYTAHEFILRGPTGRVSPMCDGSYFDRLAYDAGLGIAADRSDVAYLLGVGADLNEAARICAARKAV